MFDFEQFKHKSAESLRRHKKTAAAVVVGFTTFAMLTGSLNLPAVAAALGVPTPEELAAQQQEAEIKDTTVDQGAQDAAQAPAEDAPATDAAADQAAPADNAAAQAATADDSSAATPEAPAADHADQENLAGGVVPE